jgi:uncharacterized membrane protein YjgN (DUF898 family)
MKSFFDFVLTGKKFLPLWLVFYFLFFMPYLKLQDMRSSAINSSEPPTMIYLYSFFLILIAFVFTYFFVKIIFQNVVLNGKSIRCDFRVNRYLDVVGFGILLSMITLGIYIPWFIRNMNRYFINNSTYDSNHFTFLGKGGNLLLIFVLTIVLPLIVLIILIVSYLKIDMESQSILFKFVYQTIVLIIMIPYIYLVYKWMVDIKYKDYNIRWETDFFPAVRKCAWELMLTMITFGIYFPMAFLHLYKYFTERTKSNVVNGKQILFGYDIDPIDDFLFIWGQMFLTIVTLGIYYPWAFCKITKKVLGRTYILAAE